MLKIEIFEVVGCCVISSVVVSDEVVKWNVSVEWVKKYGVNIQCYSLVKNLQQFLNMFVIRVFLNMLGMEFFFVILFDGQLVMVGKFLFWEDIVCWVGIFFMQDWNEDSMQLCCCSIFCMF